MVVSRSNEKLLAVIDGVIETGEPAVVQRRGRRLRISMEAPTHKPRRKPFRWPEQHPEWIVGDVDDLLTIDWSRYWRP